MTEVEMAGKKKEETPAEKLEEAPKKPPAKSLKHGPMDVVRVRFNGELGMLAGRMVYRGEIHEVRYFQYLAARETGGEAYELVE
jgi:hypothetical protein